MSTVLALTAFLQPYTFSPIRLKSRSVPIQENRAFRKASYDDAHLAKSPEIHHFGVLIYIFLTANKPSPHGSVVQRKTYSPPIVQGNGGTHLFP